MKTLILTRHAKSSWDDAMLDDHSRILNDRGRRGARAIGNWLAGQGLVPGEVLVSDAARTLETWAGIAEAVGQGAKVRPLPQLYHAAPQEMLSTLQTAQEDVVLILSHNPGIAGFAAGMIAKLPAHSRFRDYPTAATCVVDFDVERWLDVQPGSGQVRHFVTPHDL